VKTQNRQEWVNWSESLRFTPDVIAEPENEEELADLVRRAAEEGRTVRPVGEGHSSTPIMATDDTLVSLRRITGLVSHDEGAGTATVRAGTGLQDYGRALHEAGLGLENYGDVDFQAIAGAVGTGTHGTGKKIGSFSSMVTGFRMVTASGDVVEVDEDDPETLRAARVSLGTLGVFAEITMRVVPSFKLRRREWCVHIEDCLENLDRLVEENRNFDFYWHPRRDEAQLRTLNVPENEPEWLLEDLPPCSDEVRKDDTDWSFEIIPQQRGLKFDEMEYMLPAENFRECFAEVRERIKEIHRQRVGWRVLCRTVAADEDFISPFYGRDTMTIALLQNNTLPHEEYFADLEPILRSYEGRPHWGKKHSLTANELRPLYPEYERFGAVRERMDPGGVFMNDYLRGLLVAE
jgi:FAD/FMN-containing dehydrogenase